MTTRSLIFTHDSRTTSRISNNSVSLIPQWSFRRSQPWPTLGLKRWSFRRSQPTYLIIKPGLLLSTLLLLLLTHSVTNYESGPYPRAWLSIDLIHSAEVAHCTHTTEPMASHSHSGGPTAFRQNRSTAMTLSRPLWLTPHWASHGWPRVYLQTPQRPPSWPVPLWDKDPKTNSTTGTQGLCPPTWSG